MEHHYVAASAVGLSRKDPKAGRSFIKHRLEVVHFRLAVERSIRGRSDLRLIRPEEIVASAPESTRTMRSPLALRAKNVQNDRVYDVGVVPDLVFGLLFSDVSRRCFMVEIDRGTMPIFLADFRQTSFERKMQAYLAAYDQGQHVRQFGLKTFRVLVETTDQQRVRSMIERAQRLNAPESLWLFLFCLTNGLQRGDPLTHCWVDGRGRAAPWARLFDRASPCPLLPRCPVLCASAPRLADESNTGELPWRLCTLLRHDCSPLTPLLPLCFAASLAPGRSSGSGRWINKAGLRYV